MIYENSTGHQLKKFNVWIKTCTIVEMMDRQPCEIDKHVLNPPLIGVFIDKKHLCGRDLSMIIHYKESAINPILRQKLLS